MEADEQRLVDAGYKPLKPLGKGGMGAVLLAEHVASGQRYAIKFLHDHLAEDDGVIDRFRLEAEALTALRHPNIVRVHEARWDSSRGPRFVVMEFLKGRSLADELVERRRLPPREALSMSIQILDGLAATHAAGVLHRDIKPDNIFVCDGPEPRTVKLTDFGIAKVIDKRSRVRPLSAPTQGELLIGTPRWCSPEAFAGDTSQLDERSDLYSVGLMLHWMVSGRLPWADVKGMQALMLAQISDVLPPLEGDLAWLDLLIASLAAKSPADRFESAGMAAGVLRQCLRERFQSEVVLLATEPIDVPRLQKMGQPRQPPREEQFPARPDPRPALPAEADNRTAAANTDPSTIGPLKLALLGGSVAIFLTLLWILFGGRS